MQRRLFTGLGIGLIVLSVAGIWAINSWLRGENGTLSRFFLSQVAPGPDEALYFVSPSSGTFTVGDTFEVEVRIGTSASTTSMQANIAFDPSLLSVVSFDNTGIDFISQGNSSFNNTAGSIFLIRFSAPPTGFLGNNGLITTITFQTKAAGTATLTYNASSLALKGDANDTNILNIAGSTSGSYTLVTPVTPTPPPPPPGGSPSPSPGSSGTSPSPSPSSSGGKSRGDLNNDGKVNIFDANILIFNWGKNAPAYDTIVDGIINIFDANILIKNWTG